MVFLLYCFLAFLNEMVSFIAKKITEEDNLGRELKNAREKKGYSLELASNEIGINPKYLAAFEENNPADLPEGIYADKFLEKYIEYLGLGKEMLLLFQGREVEKNHDGARQLRIEKEPLWERIKNFILKPSFIKSVIVCAVVIFIIIYLYSTVYNIVKPPKLNIFSPQDDLITNNYTLEIEGATDQEAGVSINDKEVFCLKGGDFIEKIDLKKGLNIVKITAKKKYSKENIVYRKILVTDGGEVGYLK
ncbi:MAG: helix-turn-helix domain-containing protein [bacterium]